MFGLPIGPQEILVILLVAVVLFGGKLPETARSLGRTWREFQKGFQDLRDQVSLDEDLGDLKRDLQDSYYQEVETEWTEEEPSPGEEEEGHDPYIEEEEYDEFYRSQEQGKETPAGDAPGAERSDAPTVVPESPEDGVIPDSRKPSGPPSGGPNTPNGT